MSLLAIVARKDMRRMLRDPAGLLIAIAIPLFVGIMLNLLNSGGGKPTAKLLVADQDSTFLSSMLLGGMQRGELAKIIATERVEEPEGRRLMDKGSASGLLIIPHGFGDALFDRQPTTVTLITNPAQRILPGILEET